MQKVSGVLTRAEDWIDVQLLETAEERSYIGYDGKTVFLSCEQQGHGYTAEFCGDKLYYIGSTDHAIHGGWTYACDVHLLDVLFPFLVSISDKRLNQEFDKWEDIMAERERQMELLPDGN